MGGRTGWTPRHLVLKERRGSVAGCAPCYLKSHSQGEYVFDYGWADAYMQAGGRYYPKLQIAVPFTPVPGRGCWPAGPTRRGQRGRARRRRRRGRRAQRHLRRAHHVPDRRRMDPARRARLLQRTDQQFHWRNAGYATFDDYLASLASRKRKATRKEREQALARRPQRGMGARPRDHRGALGRVLRVLHGDRLAQVGPALPQPQVLLAAGGQAMGERCLLMLAKRGGRPIAGSFNMVGGDCLFGRYWGAVEHQPFLHFEMCYYQAIDYAIAHKLRGSRRARRASTSWRAATCRPRPTPCTSSSIRRCAAPWPTS